MILQRQYTKLQPFFFMCNNMKWYRTDRIDVLDIMESLKRVAFFRYLSIKKEVLFSTGYTRQHCCSYRVCCNKSLISHNKKLSTNLECCRLLQRYGRIHYMKAKAQSKTKQEETDTSILKISLWLHFTKNVSTHIIFLQ